MYLRPVAMIAVLILTDEFPLYFSEEQAKLAARKYARIVQKLGFQVRKLFFLMFMCNHIHVHAYVCNGYCLQHHALSK